MPDEDDKLATVNDSIDSLRASLEEERQARLAAEGRATVAERQATRYADNAQRSGSEVQRSQLQTLESSIDQIRTQRDILKARHRSASAEGDHDMAADITADQADLAARLLYLENGREELKNRIENPPPPPQPAADMRPFDALSTDEKMARVTRGLSPSAADWVRRHPDWAQSETRVNALVGAHNAAMARGRVADTPEYFNDVERILGIDASSANGVDRNEPVRTARDVPPPAAPARSGNTGNSRRLTALERDAARTSGLSDEDYAAFQDAMVKDGRVVRH